MPIRHSTEFFDEPNYGNITFNPPTPFSPCFRQSISYTPDGPKRKRAPRPENQQQQQFKNNLTEEQYAYREGPSQKHQGVGCLFSSRQSTENQSKSQKNVRRKD
jgi:hypothetical protein